MEQQKRMKSVTFGRTTLQIIAVLTMVCDHFAYIFLWPPVSILSVEENLSYMIYNGFRIVGRVSFPIFCFLLVQGFQMTKNLKKYMLRLGIFAVLSEIPFDLAFSGIPFNWGDQNVMYTLLLGLIILALLKRFETNWLAEGMIILAGCILAIFLQSDYDYFGVLLIVVMYLLRNHQMQQMFWAAVLIFSRGGMEVYAVFALLFCYFYRWDKEEKRLPRYFFYAFYPLHLLIFWAIRNFIL